MAVTKIIAIRDRLDKRVNYVVNSEKTSLDAGVAYITNPEKTEQSFFTATVKCLTIGTAYAEMMDTKRYWNKMGGVLGFHIIQSFAPGEVTPEQAHEIGLEFCKRLFKGRFQVVIGTHLDKKHLHNHIIVNSVSYMDGKKYHSNAESYFQEIQKISDDLCRENGLSIITPEGKGKNYGEWKAEQNGKPTVRSIIREDIDRIIGEAYTYQTFLLLLQRNGYEIKNSSNRKYTAVRPPGAKRFIRLDSLGDGYTEEAIKQRLMGQRSGATQKPKQPVYHRWRSGCPALHRRLYRNPQQLEWQLLDTGIHSGDEGFVLYCRSSGNAENPCHWPDREGLSEYGQRGIGQGRGAFLQYLHLERQCGLCCAQPWRGKPLRQDPHAVHWR